MNIYESLDGMKNIINKKDASKNAMTNEECLRMLADLRIQLAKEEANEGRKILLFKIRHPIRYLQWIKTDAGKNYQLQRDMSKLMIRF